MSELLSITLTSLTAIKNKIADLSSQIIISEKSLIQLAQKFDSTNEQLKQARVNLILNESTPDQIKNLELDLESTSKQVIKEKEIVEASKSAIEILKKRLVETEAIERNELIKSLTNQNLELIQKNIDSINSVFDIATTVERNRFEISRLKDFGKVTSGVMIAVEGEKRDRIFSSIKTLKELFHLPSA